MAQSECSSDGFNAKYEKKVSSLSGIISQGASRSSSNLNILMIKSDRNLREEPMTHISQAYDDEPDPDEMDHCWSRFMLTDRNRIRLAWSVVVCVLLIYVATIFLYRFAFWTFHIGADGLDPLHEDHPVWTFVDYLVDALFWVDLFISFFMTYKDSRGREIDSFKLVAKQYLKFYFWLNLLACLPEQVFAAMFSAPEDQTTDTAPGVDFRVARVYRLQRISRLARLARVTRLFKLAQIMGSSHLWKEFQALRGVRVVNFIVGLLWALHCLACGWYLCAALHNDVTETWVARRAVNVNGQTLLEAEPFEQWLVAMYFVLTVFTTVGFGDISAGTEAEIIYVAFTMLIGAVVHSIIISEVIGIVTSTDEVQKVVSKQLTLIDGYAAHTQLSPETSRAMKSEIGWRAKNWAVSYGFDKSEMKDLITGKYMPRWLIAEMPQSLFRGNLMKNNFLRCISNVPPRLPCLLALHLLWCDFMSGEAVYQMGDFPFNLFLVTNGTFAHVARPSTQGGIDAMDVEEVKICGNGTFGDLASANACAKEAAGIPRTRSSSSFQNEGQESQHLFPYRLFSMGSYFGDVEMILGRPRFSTTRCERKGSTLTLHKRDFVEIDELFPQFGAAWTSGARRRERYRARCLAKLTHGVGYKCLAATWIQEHVRHKRAKTIPEQGSSERMMSEVSHACILRSAGVQRLEERSSDRHTQAAIDGLRQEMRVFRKEMLDLMKQHQRPQSEGSKDLSL